MAKQVANSTWQGARSHHAFAAHVKEVLPLLKAIATQQQVDPSTVARAWVALLGVIPICGVSSVTQLAPNLRVLDVQLTSAQVHDLNALTAVPLG